jgi:2-oxo-4-hydroxy-4-carboxy-5-ureidoimidazoline decarboxylase
MISLSQLNAAPDEEFVATLGGIYEHSDWVPQRVLGGRPFDDAENLRLAMRQAVESATAEEKLALIQAHPDLAGKLARAGGLTDASTQEQAGLGLDRLSDAEYEIFSSRNDSYREKFGFPFIICARLTTKQGVLDAFEARLGNSREAEISEALRQIHEIARLRLGDLFARSLTL